MTNLFITADPSDRGVLRLAPISLKSAKSWVNEHHRHNQAPVGWKWGVALEEHGVQVGVAMAGRPVARGLDDGVTLEVTRVCTLGHKNANSMLYGAIARAAAALGYQRLITYTLKSESGSSLRASGFREDGEVRGREWTTPSRPRQKSQEVGYVTENKIRWVRDL